jgi:TetR/AcrR family transcriptional repressor of nem operon
VTDRRSQIVDAAARLMAQRGFAPTSVDDVIKEAKLSGKSHFYHYFRSKEELGYAVLARQFERFTERGLAVLREPMIDPIERLALFIDTLVALQIARGLQGGSPFGSLAAELADTHDGFRERIAVVFERWAAQIRSLLWEARPLLHDDVDTTRLARFIIATLEGALLMARVNRDAAALEGIAYDLKRFVAMHLRDGGPLLGARPAAASAAEGDADAPAPRRADDGAPPAAREARTAPALPAPSRLRAGARGGATAMPAGLVVAAARRASA